mgnify:CR=1 FL=1
MLHQVETSLVFVAHHQQSLEASESLKDSALESFVLLVYLPELLLTVVLYNIVHINMGCLEESLGLLRVSVVSNLDLLALNLHLLDLGVLYLRLFIHNWG